MSIQEALKLLRSELGMTQEDFAQKINKAFVTVNRWENGKTFPTRKAAVKIINMAKEYHVSEDCINYLNTVMLPDTKRSHSVSSYGFPEINKDLLFQMADASNNSLYIVDSQTYELLYFNRAAEKSASQHRIKYPESYKVHDAEQDNDRRCFYYFGGRDNPCSFCPLAEVDDKGYKDVDIDIPNEDRRVRVHAKMTVLNGRNVYIVYLTDITQENAERKALYRLTNDIPKGVGIYHSYNDGRIELEFMNTILFQMIGEERHKAMLNNKLSGFCLIHPDDMNRLKKIIENSMQKKKDFCVDMHMRVRDRKYHLVNISAKIIKYNEERFTYYCVFTEYDRN